MSKSEKPSKALALAASLPVEELQALRHYLGFAAPKKEKLAILTDWLITTLPAHPNLRMEEAAEIPGISAASIPRYFSEWYQYAVEFLAYREMMSRPGLKEIYAMQQFRRLGLPLDAAIERNALDALDNYGDSPDTYLGLFWLKRLQLEQKAESNPRGKAFQLDILHLSFQLRRFFALELAQHLCEQAALENILSKESEPSDPVVQEVDPALPLLYSMAEGWDLLKLYLDLRGAIQTGNFPLDAVTRLRKATRTAAVPLSRDLWTMAFNGMNPGFNHGRDDLQVPLFDLLEMGVDLGHAFLPDGKIRPAFYKNYMVAALRCGRLAAAVGFASKYRKLLPEGQEGLVHYCDALASFHAGNFQEAHQHLIAMDYTKISDLYFTISGRFLHAKLHYELGEMEVVGQDLDSLRMLLTQNKQIGAYHREAFKKRLRFFTRLHSLHQSPKPRPEKLIQELAGEQVDDRGWLLEKAKKFRA